jgi:hypothetical protein
MENGELRINNRKLRNDKIREEIRKLVGMGYQMKLAIGLVAEKWYLSEATVRDVVYDKRRK